MEEDEESQEKVGRENGKYPTGWAGAGFIPSSGDWQSCHDMTSNEDISASKTGKEGWSSSWDSIG